MVNGNRDLCSLHLTPPWEGMIIYHTIISTSRQVHENSNPLSLTPRQAGQKIRHRLSHRRGLLQHDHMPRAGHDDELRAGDLFVQRLAVFDRRHAIGVAAEDEGRGHDAAHVVAAVERVAGEEVVAEGLGIHLAQPARVETQQVRLHVLAVCPLRQKLSRARVVVQDAGQDLRCDAQLGARADQDQAGQPRRIAQGEFKAIAPPIECPARTNRTNSSASAKPRTTSA